MLDVNDLFLILHNKKKCSFIIITYHDYFCVLIQNKNLQKFSVEHGVPLQTRNVQDD